MKKTLLIVLLFAAFLQVQAQQTASKPFTISGDVSGLGDSLQTVYLFYSVDGKSKTDTVQIENGRYRFSGVLSEPVLGRLRIGYTPDAEGKPRRINGRRDLGAVFLEPGDIRVKSVDSFSNFKVEGAPIHQEYVKLAKRVDRSEKLQPMYEQYSELSKAKDEEGMKQLSDKISAIQKESTGEYLAYLKENPNGPLALYALQQYAGWDIDPVVVEPAFNGLSAAMRNSPSGKAFQQKIETAKKTSVGAMAMDFTQNDTLGKPVSLSSYKGKYVLIDFWASWCGPCRVENPNVVKAFQKYNNKGFDVLGVSLDQPNARDKWLKAIYDDQLTWTHVSDLKFWQNEVAVQYGIQAIPQNFLVDPQGKIIAKNLRGEALQEKMKEIFGAE